MTPEKFNTKYIALTNEHDEKTRYYITKRADIVEGYLHDTYNNYGQRLSESDAEDYCYANLDSSFRRDLREHLDDKFVYLAGTEYSLNDDKCVESDGLTPAQISDINAEIEAYCDENEPFTEATYMNYWDGSNMKTILISEFGYQEVEKEDLLKDIREAISNAEMEEKGDRREGSANGYLVQTWLYASNPWLYELTTD